MSKRPFPKLQLPPGIGNGIGNSSSESLNSLDGSSRQTPAGSRPPAPPGHPPVPPPVIPLTLPHIPPRQFARSSDSLPAAIGPIMTTNTTSIPEQRPGMKPRLNLSEIMPAGADGPPKSNPTIQSNTQSAAVPLGSSASNIAASSIKNVQESDLQPMEELGVGSGGTVFKASVTVCIIIVLIVLYLR